MATLAQQKVAKLNDHIKEQFPTWLTQTGIESGGIPVELSLIVAHFNQYTGYPCTKQMFSRLFSPLFMKRVDCVEKRTYYFLNKDLSHVDQPTRS